MPSPRRGPPPAVGAEQRAAPLGHTGLGLGLSSRYLGPGQEPLKAPQEGAVAASLRSEGWEGGSLGSAPRVPLSQDIAVLRGRPPHLMFVLQTASRGSRCLSSCPVSLGAAREPPTPTPAMPEVPLPSAFPASLPGGDFRAVLSGVVTADVLDDAAVHRQVWCEL